MRRLIVLLVLGAGLWSGYWFAGSTALQRGAETWFADQTARGMTAENTALSVMGYPNRFDMRVEGLRLADPQTGFGWQAPFAEVYSMTWKPWHIIAALPPEQVITTPEEEIILAAEGLKASLRASPTLDLPLAAAIVESGSFTATSTGGWTISALRSAVSLKAVSVVAAEAGVDAVAEDENSYILRLDIEELAPDPAIMSRFTAEAGLPPVIDFVQVLGSVKLTAPLDRHLGETVVMPLALELDRLDIGWGKLGVAASGKIAPDSEGYAAGRIEIAVTNWQPLVPMLVAAGAIKPELALTVENMMAALAKEGGDPNVLKLPLVMDGGRMSLGPLPLGAAPMMVGPSG